MNWKGALPEQREIDSYEKGENFCLLFFILFTMEMENGWEKWIEKTLLQRPGAMNTGKLPSCKRKT